MVKYYRVLKDTFMWEKGAILKQDATLGRYGGYMPLEDIWNITDNQDEYISTNIIENNPLWFEKVYADNLEKMVFKTKEELKKVYNKFKN